jgi:hypothetical protein
MNTDLKKTILFIAGVLMCFLFACTSEKPGDMSEKLTTQNALEPATGSPAGTKRYAGKALTLSPEAATKKTVFRLSAKGLRLSDAGIKWYVNDYMMDVEGLREFRSADLKKGDRIQARAFIGGEEIASNVVEIKNAKPELTRVKIMPETFMPGDRLRVDVEGLDPDGDEVTITTEWTKNGEPAGSDRMIGVPLKRGDKVSVKIVPFDQEDYGKPVILDREIRNYPPAIAGEKELSFDGNICTYKVSGTDPDGDPLTFSLKEAPEGMSIDPETGLISWSVPPEFKGNAKFTACVKDGQGGEAVQQFTINIGEK